jgi:hypothetical protein
MKKYQALNGWTKQTIWLAIAKGNLGEQSISLTGGPNACAYRGDGGNKCSIGVFIPDDVYDPCCEGASVKEVLEDYPGLTAYMPLPVRALTQLQDVHDSCDPHLDPRIRLLIWVEDHVA